MANSVSFERFNSLVGQLLAQQQNPSAADKALDDTESKLDAMNTLFDPQMVTDTFSSSDGRIGGLTNQKIQRAANTVSAKDMGAQMSMMEYGEDVLGRQWKELYGK